MRTVLATVALGLMLSASALAQSSTSGQGNASTAGQANSGSASQGQANLVTANKIRNELQSAGFTDVNVVAEAFVVRAKSKDGNPVVMTIGPHGFTAFEAVSSTSGSGSSTHSGNASSNSSSGSGGSSSAK